MKKEHILTSYYFFYIGLQPSRCLFDGSYFSVFPGGIFDRENTKLLQGIRWKTFFLNTSESDKFP